MFKSLRSEVQEVVGIKIQYQSDQDNNTEGNETSAVFHHRKEGDQEDPENCVVDKPYDGKRVGISLFYDLSIPSLFFELSEPLGCVGFDANSIDYSDQSQPDQSPFCGPE